MVQSRSLAKNMQFGLIQGQAFSHLIKYKGYLDHVELHIISSYSRSNTRLTSSQTCHMLPLDQSNIEAIVVLYIHQKLLIFMNEPICHGNMSICSNHVLSKV